jgi:hypothetical protein
MAQFSTIITKNICCKIIKWSDIDFICLTEKSLSTLQITELVNLRQKIMHEKGQLLIGDDFRQFIEYPSRQEIIEAVRSHYFTIRKYAKETGESIKACGWILDIPRLMLCY